MNQPSITVVLAAYQPSMKLLKRQVDSVLAQQRVDLRLFIVTDGPMPQISAIVALAESDERIELFEQTGHRGSTRTFLEAVKRLSQHTWFVRNRAMLAFSDQDDEWEPDRLIATIEPIEAAAVDGAHADARLVDADGHVINESLFAYGGKTRDPALAELLFRNNATGMAMTLSHDAAIELAALASHRPANWLHDHLAAFVAATGKGLAFVDRPLVSYRQHAANQVGAGTYAERSIASLEFLSRGSKPARILAESRALLDFMLERQWVSGETRRELSNIRCQISPKGTGALASALKFALRVPMHRSIKARLMWEAAFPFARD